MSIRAEQSSDIKKIWRINASAFETEEEPVDASAVISIDNRSASASNSNSNTSASNSDSNLRKRGLNEWLECLNTNPKMKAQLYKALKSPPKKRNKIVLRRSKRKQQK